MKELKRISGFSILRPTLGDTMDYGSQLFLDPLWYSLSLVLGFRISDHSELLIQLEKLRCGLVISY
jgi:hypothetical protein